MNGLTTVSSEEPYVNSTSTVLWEVPGGNPGLPTRCVLGMSISDWR